MSIASNRKKTTNNKIPISGSFQFEKAGMAIPYSPVAGSCLPDDPEKTIPGGDGRQGVAGVCFSIGRRYCRRGPDIFLFYSNDMEGRIARKE